MPPSSRLRLKLVVMPLSWLMAALRALLPWTLMGLLALGGWRYFSRPFQAGALEFTPHTVNGATTAEGVNGLAAQDMDADGDIDVVTAGKDGTKVYINNGSEKFETKIVDDKDGERVQVIDLNRDGTPDLLVTLKGQNPSVIWYDNRSGVEFEGTTIGTGTDGLAYAGDIDGDGAPDIVTALNSGGNIILQRWMNNGTGGFSSTTLDSNSGITSLTIGDIDGNGYNDIVSGGSKGLQRWHTTNGTSWSRIDIDDKNGNKTHLVTADVDKDGKTDIVTVDATEDLVAWYDNQDNSTWQRKGLTGADAKTVAVRDLDEDGDEDILAAAQDANSVYWYENNGQSEFTQRTAATDVASVYGVAVNDVDSDNDFDFVAGDHVRGTVWWYERLRAKPVATKPTNMKQATDGSGRVTFETTISDGDGDPTRLRIQYSTDGLRWHKPWLTKVAASSGKVDLKNSNGYQVGTKDSIDTTNSQSVKLTFTWDTKSAENTGGPLSGDISTVQLRVIPRDNVSVGKTVTSSSFRVDLAPPKNLKLALSSITDEEAHLTWTRPSDSSEPVYKVYFGTDAKAVIEQRSEVWDKEDDAAMADFETTTTAITGLTAGKTYTFKLIATDKFGNSAGAASVQSKAAALTTPTPTAAIGAAPTPSVSPAATFVPGTNTPLPAATATLVPTPLTTLADNIAPTADAGPNQVVNPSALVILDGTASFDADRDSLVHVWRQLAGPRVDLLSARTATPSFSAGEAGATYIFFLTVRDPRGASATDAVTVAVKDLPDSTTIPVEVDSEPAAPLLVNEAQGEPAWIKFLFWLDLALFSGSVLSASVSLAARISHRVSQRRFFLPGGTSSARAAGKAVHYQTAEPIAGAQVLIYDEAGKLKKSERTNDQGEFPTLVPAGRYTLDVRSEGFTFAPASTRLPLPDGGLLYTGGVLTVPGGRRPINIVVPMKPIGRTVGGARTGFLQVWQNVQRLGRFLSWPLFLTGALLNTFLVFRSPSALYLTIEILYVVLVVIKVVLEVRVRPAYGLVRDAITHVPLDLAVVRLYEGGTNRLMMTRVTNAQGKFFALPSAGTYTVTITKPGYAVFSKPNIEITSEQDSALQITADLMPVAPAGGLASAASRLAQG